MTNKTLLLSALCAVSVHLAFAANTWYVDNKIGNFGYDGKSPVVNKAEGRGPKYKIQEAIEAAEDGDTILVAPGVYGDDQGVVPSGAIDGVSYNQCRVLVKKNLTIKSMGGKDVTHIVGKWGVPGDEVSSAGHANSISCIVIAKSAKGSEIEGFTIRDGARATKNTALAPGVTYLYGTSMMPTQADLPQVSDLPFVVDCVISNCATKTYGAIQMINGVRLYICWNLGGATTPSAVERCNLLYSVIAHNGSVNANSHPLRSGRYIVNCTFCDTPGNTTSNSEPGEFYNCMQSDSRGTLYAAIAKDNCVCAGFSNGQQENNDRCPYFGLLMAPMLGDYRLVAQKPEFCTNSVNQAVGHAKEDWLAFFPEKYRYTDFNGQTVVPVNGQLNAGAVQEVATPIAGFYIPSGCNMTNLTVNGARPRTGGNGQALTFFTDKYPMAYDFRFVGEDYIVPFHGFTVNQRNGVYRFFDKDRKCLFVPQKGFCTDLRPRKANTHVYVDPDGDDEAAGTQAAPVRTLQKAIGKVTNSSDTFAIIHLASGTYAEGGAAMNQSDGETKAHNVRMNVPAGKAYIALVGDEGPEKTIIMGAADSDYADGNGPKAYKCIRCNINDTSGGAFCVRDVTLTGGHTARYDNQSSSYGTGPALCVIGDSKNAPVYAMDCIISNNTGYSTGVSYYGVFQRCRIVDNMCVKQGLFASSCFVSSCEVVENVVLTNGMMASDAGSFIGSTFIGRTDLLNAFAPRNMCHVFDSIVCHAREWTGTPARDDSKRKFCGAVFDDFAYDFAKCSNKEGVNFVRGGSLFVGEGNGDLHIASGSAAVGIQSAWGRLDTAHDALWNDGYAWTNYYRYVTYDMDGNVPAQLRGGVAVAGCHTVPVRQTYTVDVEKNGEDCTLSVEKGTNSVDFGAGPIVVTAENGKRKVLGLVINGEYKEGETSATINVPEAYDPAFPANFTVCARLNENWYADASKNGAGWTPEEASGTLQGAMDKAVSGETVFVAPGVYDQGEKLHTMIVNKGTNTNITVADIKLPSRVVVKAGVELKSLEGPEKTIIKGAFAPTQKRYGEGAVRCAFVEDGGKLTGFTLTGGSTLDGSTVYQAEFFDNVSGGGVLCQKLGGSKSVVRDCIFTNNVGCGSAAATYGNYVNCLFSGNYSPVYCLREPYYMVGCVVDGNFTDSPAAYNVYHGESCTFGSGNKRFSKNTNQAATYTYPGSAKWFYRNCLFLGGGQANTVKWAYNCVAGEGALYANNNQNVWEAIATNNVAVDAAWRPIDSASPAVDAWKDGSDAVNADFRYNIPELYALGDTDFCGGQRIYNGTMDIGAGEHNWCPDYAKILHAGAIEVTSASTNVVAIEGGVMIPTDAELTAAYESAKPQAGKFAVTLDEAASLAFTLNGETTEPVAEGTHAIGFAKGLNTLSFAVTGEGAAVLTALKRDAGFVFLLR